MTELAYQIPGTGRAKTTLRIPESHSLYLCPGACGRRQGIRALKNGVADQASFLMLSEADVVMGDYVAQVEDAVRTLLDAISPTPRVIALYVNCVDDFLGTDLDSLLADLHGVFPQVKFLKSRINPIAQDVAGGSARRAHARLYELLESVPAFERDAGVTIVGNFTPIPATSEFHAVLRAAGAGPVRQLVTCTTFDEYAALAKSRLCVSVSHLGEVAAADLERRLDLPWMAWNACYDEGELTWRYDRLANLLGAEPPDCTAWRTAAREATVRARAAVGDLPIFVDSSATFLPFTLACSLAERGFNVAGVFALHLKASDEAGERRLAHEFPQIPVIKRESYEAIQGYDFPQECVSVGADAAFLLRAHHVVDLYHDEGLFGFDGIVRLMDALASSVQPVREWRS